MARLDADGRGWMPPSNASVGTRSVRAIVSVAQDDSKILFQGWFPGVMKQLAEFSRRRLNADRLNLTIHFSYRDYQIRGSLHCIPLPIPGDGSDSLVGGFMAFEQTGAFSAIGKTPRRRLTGQPVSRRITRSLTRRCTA